MIFKTRQWRKLRNLAPKFNAASPEPGSFLTTKLPLVNRLKIFCLNKRSDIFLRWVNQLATKKGKSLLKWSEINLRVFIGRQSYYTKEQIIDVQRIIKKKQLLLSGLGLVPLGILQFTECRR